MSYSDLNPPNVGGPGEPAARVVYPPQKGGYYNYNYKDTVDVEWVSWAANNTETTMQIWYWAPNFADNQWQPLDLSVVPQNGTMSYTLDGVQNHSTGWYLGQWNLNFTRQDASPVTGLTLSNAFNCTFDDSKAAVTHSYTPSSTASSAPSSTSDSSDATSTTSATDPATVTATANPTGSPSSGVMAAAASATSSSAPSGSMSSGISGGAVAGIVIGVLAAIAIAALAAFFLWRRNRNNGEGANPGYPPPAYYQQPGFAPNHQQQQHQQQAYGYPPQQQHQAYPSQGGYTGQDYKQPVPQMSQPYTEHYQQQAFVTPPPPAAPAQNYGQVSELPSHSDAGGHSNAFRQELPAERYS